MILPEEFLRRVLMGPAMGPAAIGIISGPIPLVSGSETYNDIGRINTLVYLPDNLPAAAAAWTETSFATRFGKSWKNCGVRSAGNHLGCHGEQHSQDPFRASFGPI